jgi:hypothetical protein
MLGVTAFGIFFTPVFYSVVRKFTESKDLNPAEITPSDQSKPTSTAAQLELVSDGNGATPTASPKAVRKLS